LKPLEPKAKPRHFSMIRDFHLADFIALSNAACGFGGVTSSSGS
jgi:CDP-diacylglycerol--serine O-phosphatidyltransferase